MEMDQLRTAAQQVMAAWQDQQGMKLLCEAMDALGVALEQAEQTSPWRDAVDDELVSLHMVASDDPRESIRRLIDWHCAVQIDPLVSSAAQELIERGKREALEQSEQERGPELRELLIAAAAMAVAAERKGAYQGASWVADAVLERQEDEPRSVEEIAAEVGREFGKMFSGKRAEPEQEPLAIERVEGKL